MLKILQEEFLIFNDSVVTSIIFKYIQITYITIYMHSWFFITVLFVFYVAERRNNTLAWTYVKTAFLMVSFIRWFIVYSMTVVIYFHLLYMEKLKMCFTKKPLREYGKTQCFFFIFVSNY
jgi:hypothetical protein